MAVYDLTQYIPSPEELTNGDILNCPYSGGIINVTLPKGSFKLEAWGACGYSENRNDKNIGGRGGYCTGIYRNWSAEQVLYLVAGGRSKGTSGGYNGGGTGWFSTSTYESTIETYSVRGGGGCSHIATNNGILSSLSSFKESVLLVAGGGGGSSCYSYSSDSGSSYTYTGYRGGDGGGLTGGSGSGTGYHAVGTGGTQDSPGTGQNGSGDAGFGQGTNEPAASDGGGGGGWYGGGPGLITLGYASRQSSAGGGSSHYNTALLNNYSSISGNSSIPSTSGGSEIGHSDNGYIRITILNVSPYPEVTSGWYFRSAVGKWTVVDTGTVDYSCSAAATRYYNGTTLALDSVYQQSSIADKIWWTDTSRLSGASWSNNQIPYIENAGSTTSTAFSDAYVKISSDINNVSFKNVLGKTGIFWKLATANKGPLVSKKQFFLDNGDAINCSVSFSVSTSSTNEPTEWYSDCTQFLTTTFNPGTYYHWYKIVGVSDYNSTTVFCPGTTVVIRAPQTYDVTQQVPDPGALGNGDVLLCPYAGRSIAVQLPAGSYKLETWGGKGGNSATNGGTIGYGGNGGYSTGTYSVTEKLQTVYLTAGGIGSNTGNSTNAGGYNGGGNGTSYNGAASRAVGGGGGCSHIATVTGLLNSLSASQSSVILVAGGGGGSVSNYKYGGTPGGVGGGQTGGSGESVDQTAGSGGTQYAGGTGANGSCGSGFGQGAYDSDGGGGGGWYGGGPGWWKSSSSSGTRAAGGGGSSYYNTSLLTDYSTIAGNASMPAPGGGTESGHASSGYIKITILEITPRCQLFVNVAGTWKQCTNAYVNVGGTWKEVSDTKTNVGGEWK